MLRPGKIRAFLFKGQRQKEHMATSPLKGERQENRQLPETGLGRLGVKWGGGQGEEVPGPPLVLTLVLCFLKSPLEHTRQSAEHTFPSTARAASAPVPEEAWAHSVSERVQRAKLFQTTPIPRSAGLQAAQPRPNLGPNAGRGSPRTNKAGGPGCAGGGPGAAAGVHRGAHAGRGHLSATGSQPSASNYRSL